jgi:hypothetical protein
MMRNGEFAGLICRRCAVSLHCDRPQGTIPKKSLLLDAFSCDQLYKARRLAAGHRVLLLALTWRVFILGREVRFLPRYQDMLGISRTPPLRSFQSVAGLTTFHVNTIAIGLELVAAGGTRPNAMHVKWTPPKNPREAVEQTKHFVLLALMAHVIDAFDGFLRDYADLDWLDITAMVREILRKSVTKPGGKAWSIRERVEQLLPQNHENMDELIAFLDLAVGWRNALVHSSRAETRLSADTIQKLTQSSQEIALKYANIDIRRALDNFEAAKWPTLKEATTMIAAMQNLARSIDRALLVANAGTTSRVELIARREIGKGLAKFQGGWKKVWGRNAAARARVLANLLSSAGVVESAEPISASLGESFVRDLACADRLILEELVSKVS